MVLRDQSKVGVGLMDPGSAGYAQLYLVGSGALDRVTATYSAGSPAVVTFVLDAGSAAQFDASSSASSGCEPPGPSQVSCSLSRPLDSIVLAGLGSDDVLQAKGFPASVGVMVAGGEGSDSLTGGEESEDVLADGPDASGPGGDTLSALGGDDALLNNGGADQLFGGTGNDLFLSDSICDGDLLDGEAGRDNSSWAKYKDSGVEANLGSGDAGRPGSGGAPQCAGGSLDSLEAIEDLEGTSSGDVFYGGPDSNQLLGWAGSDTYFAAGGSDRILANSGDDDPTVDCGEGTDVALIDRPPFEDVAVDCETVQEADPNNFRVETGFEVPVVTPPQPGQGKPGSSTARPRPSCLGATRFPGNARTARCSVRPPGLRLRAGASVKRLRWAHWGARRALGFGQLTRHVGGRTFVAGSKIAASLPQRCKSRRWFTRLTITYGPGFQKSLVRRLASPTPCD